MTKTRDTDLKVRGRIWVETTQGAFLGAGRIELLMKIEKLGSITRAARAMKMSYRQAWELIDSMNKRASSPLVITQSGGKGGGGAEITKTAKIAIRKFKDLQEAFKAFQEQQSKIFGL